MGRAPVCVCKNGKLKRLYERDASSRWVRTDWRKCDACGSMQLDPKKVKP